MTGIHVETFIGANDTQLVGDVGGDPDAPPVILLHGGGQTRHSWRQTMQSMIADRYRVISLDARGHGDSQWSKDGAYSLDLFAEDLRSVLRTLPRKPALVGASLGGLTSLVMLGEDPEAACALVLVDIVPRSNTSGVERIQAFMRRHLDGFDSLQEVSAAVRQYNPQRQDGNDLGLMKNLRVRDDGRLYWHWDPRFISRIGEVDIAEAQARLDDAASRIKIPTLLVRGMRSDITSDDGVSHFKALMPHLEVCNIADASHMVAGDENDVFAGAVMGFLMRHNTGLPP